MPKFAKTLERIRNDPEDFYNGELAKDIVQDIKDGGGIFTLDDLKNYKVKFKRPTNGTVGNYSWYSTPPPGSGVVLGFIINILKGKLLSTCNITVSATIDPELLNLKRSEKIPCRYSGREYLVSANSN